MKKAQMSEELVRILKVVMASVVLLSLIGVVFIRNLNENEDIEICRFSFIAGDVIKQATLGMKGVALQCPRKVIEFNKGDLSRLGKFKKSMLLEEIAQQVRICNYMTNEGRSDPFDRSWFDFNTACIICADIRFDESARNNFGNEKVTVLPYLQSTIMPKSNNSVTYLDYINTKRGIDYTKKTGSQKGDQKFSLIEDVSVSREYYVIYRYATEGRFMQGDDYLMKNVLKEYDDDVDHSAILLIDKDHYKDIGCHYNAN